MTPAALLSKLLGPRKAATADTIGAEIEARRAALEKAEATVAAAAQARAEALSDCDVDGMACAEAEGAAARRVVEAGARALDVLTAAHTARVEVERKAAQDQRAAELIAEGKALAAEFGAEWDRAAAVLARLRHRAAMHDLTIDNALFAGSIASGAVPHAEGFRGAVGFSESMPAIVGLNGSTLWPAPLPESDRVRAKREADEEHDRRQEARKAKEAERRRAWLENEGAQRQAEREAEDQRAQWRERNPYYGESRDVPDAAR